MSRLAVLDATGAAQYTGFQTPGALPVDPGWPPDIVLPPGLPDYEDTVAAAGLSNPGLLGPPQTAKLTVTTDGAVIENRDQQNVTDVKASNVTFRNCRFQSQTSSYVVRTYAFSNILFENCEMIGEYGQGGDAVLGVGGDHITVRYCDITATNFDAIKARPYSLYEYNYIHPVKQAGSTAHLDGIQASGTSDFTIRRNVIEVPRENGGNSCIIMSPWVASTNTNYLMKNTEIYENHLLGGNTVVHVSHGATNAVNPTNPSDPQGLWHISGRIEDNMFWRDNNPKFTDSIQYRYLYTAHPETHTIDGNVDDTNDPLTLTELRALLP